MPTEIGPDGALERLMAIYEADNEEQVWDNAKKLIKDSLRILWGYYRQCICNIIIA